MRTTRTARIVLAALSVLVVAGVAAAQPSAQSSGELAAHPSSASPPTARSER